MSEGFFVGTGMPDSGWWEALWPEPAKVLADSGIMSGMRVADLCSGDGWFTLQIARIASEVTAIDLDAKLLEIARLRLGEAALNNVRYVACDAYDIAAHVNEPVDYVFLANAFHGVPDKQRLSGAVHRVLNPGGLFGVVNWYDRPREETVVLGQPRGPTTGLRMSPESTRAIVEPCGFELQRVADVSPYHYTAVFEKLEI